MVAKLIRLTHKIAIQLHLVADLAPGGQSGNFWVQPRTTFRKGAIRTLLLTAIL